MPRPKYIGSRLSKYLFLYPSNENFRSIGLLVLRVLVGFSLILHGSMKVAVPLTWLGPTVPAVFQFLAVFAEVVGGGALILGGLVPLASVGIVATMTGAILFHVQAHDPIYRLTISATNEGSGVIYMGMPDWFVIGGGHSPGGSGSAELAFLFWIFAFTLIFTGAGKYSIDAFIMHRIARWI